MRSVPDLLPTKFRIIIINVTMLYLTDRLEVGCSYSEPGKS